MSEAHALLLTDIVDSTQLTEQLGHAAMSALWAAHDHAARGLLREWRGREIDKSDGFLLLFDAVADALGFALAYHRALAQLSPPLQARAGLHHGPVTLRENPAADVALGAKPLEVDGLAKPLAARVMALALGGQTLLTEAACAALGDTTLRQQSHGHWRLKGVETAVELFEVGEAQAPFTPPPDSAKAWRVLRQGELWLPRRELQHTLPAERDSFIGRQSALQELAQRFEGGARLVSLLGTGGTGKTRLAQRYGWTWLGDYPGGVWFCDLSPASTLDGIVHAVAQGLELPLGQVDPVQQIGQAIHGRGACLVVLDNFEQVARHAEATLGQWLDRAPEARFLVTSREVLGIVGEEAMSLPPLPPEDSVTLFLRRAVAASQGFKPGPEDSEAIGPLVALLDGLPLAIELCAARVRVMPPRQLLQRMSDRFKLLAGGSGRRDRQATLRNTLDWSWDLLRQPERAALAQLSVFEGGFTIASAEAVVDLSAFDEAPWVVDVLQSLVQKSLVRKVSERRFDLLRSVKDYATEYLRTEGRFTGSGTTGQVAAMARHWEHFAGLDERAAVADRCAEAENLVAACRRATQHQNPSVAIATLSNASAALRLSGPLRVALDLGAQVESLADLNPAGRATVHRVLGSVFFLAGQFDHARRHLESGLVCARSVNDRLREAEILRHLGELMHAQGIVDQAHDRLTQALSIGRQLGNVTLQYRALNALGALSSELSRLYDARTHYEAALSLASEAGDQRWVGGLHGNLGAMFHEQGRFDEAESHYVQALRIASDLGDRLWAGNSACNLGLLHAERGRTRDARVLYERALLAARDMGHQALEFTVLCNLGLACEAEGALSQSKQHYEVAIRLADAIGESRTVGRFRVYLGRLCARMGDVDEAQRCFQLSEAALIDLGDSLSVGLLNCARAELACRLGDPEAGLLFCQRAANIVANTGVTPLSELGMELSRIQALLGAPIAH